ncbi:hypothetical protein SAMN05421788_10921 [Filimonas lacunae]|uniref:Uncharacterized protein n=1 Tax=Filimonas lacunae TaxID=477680 RepID=A0A1N7R3S6_9BACT|nr:hypothetical protein SAMN05421788_10921 [Filimonas lacunae]
MVLVAFMCLCLTDNIAQTTSNDRIQYCIYVIKKNIKNKVFEKARIDAEYGKIETNVCYLGLIGKGFDTFKILNVSVISGMSHRATNEIYVFNKGNKYLGRYKGFFEKELPLRISENKLVFKNIVTSGCKLTQSVFVGFENGPPKQILFGCNTFDDRVYSFFSVETDK